MPINVLVEEGSRLGLNRRLSDWRLRSSWVKGILLYWLIGFLIFWLLGFCIAHHFGMQHPLVATFAVAALWAGVCAVTESMKLANIRRNRREDRRDTGGGPG